MRHWRWAFTTGVVLALTSCATLDQKYGDNKVYQETRDLSVKTAHEVATVAAKASDRMKHYLQEKDLLQTFHDAGEHSETAVLDVLHKAGVKHGGAAAGPPPGGTRPPGNPPSASKGPASGAPPKGSAPSIPVPQQYAGNLRWPLDAGIISSEYGERWGKLHKGIDIAADTGEPVYAIAAGEVIYAGDGLHGYGNVVILRHDAQMTSLYAHNSELKVHQGDHVEQGALLALLGSTGHSTGPHVHFEIREGDAAVNPHTLLPKNKLSGSGSTKVAARDP